MTPFNAGLSPAAMTLIRFADHEKEKSLTAVEPIVVVNFAIAILPG